MGSAPVKYTPEKQQLDEIPISAARV